MTDRASAEAWIKALCADGRDFHFEDDPETIIVFRTGRLIFQRMDIPFVRAQVAALYTLDWGVYDCPIGYMLACLKENRTLDYWTVSEWEEYANGQIAKVVHADHRLAVLYRAGRFEVAYRDMELSAEGAWINPVDGEADFETLDAALAAAGRVAEVAS